MQGVLARAAIRGREQQMVDSLGGVNDPSVANIDRPVSPINPNGYYYHFMSSHFFGQIAEYTGLGLGLFK